MIAFGHGSSATDLARETASLVLPKGGLWMLPWVITVTRSVRRTIVTNLIWAFGYNLVALDTCRSRDLAAGTGGRRHGEFEPAARGQFAAAVSATRSCSVGDPACPPSGEPDSVRRGLGIPVMADPAVERG